MKKKVSGYRSGGRILTDASVGAESGAAPALQNQELKENSREHCAPIRDETGKLERLVAFSNRNTFKTARFMGNRRKTKRRSALSSLLDMSHETEEEMGKTRSIMSSNRGTYHTGTTDKYTRLIVCMYSHRSQHALWTLPTAVRYRIAARAARAAQRFAPHIASCRVAPRASAKHASIIVSSAR